MAEHLGRGHLLTNVIHPTYVQGFSEWKVGLSHDFQYFLHGGEVKLEAEGCIREIQHKMALIEPFLTVRLTKYQAFFSSHSFVAIRYSK